MAADILKNAETGFKDLTSNAVVYEICNLRGGEAVTIKALAANTGVVYIGFHNAITSTNGFQLAKGESIDLKLPIEFGANNYLQIYGLSVTSGDDVCYIKLIDLYPSINLEKA